MAATTASGGGADGVPAVIDARGDVRRQFVAEACNQGVRAKSKEIRFAPSR